MLGAIIGDIVGSVYEWNNIKTKDFPLFSDKCFFTDDTVMTIAVADALMNGGTEDNFIDSMKKYGRMYPDSGYGVRFSSGLFIDLFGSLAVLTSIGYKVSPSEIIKSISFLSLSR